MLIPATRKFTATPGMLSVEEARPHGEEEVRESPRPIAKELRDQKKSRTSDGRDEDHRLVERARGGVPEARHREGAGPSRAI